MIAIYSTDKLKYCYFKQGCQQLLLHEWSAVNCFAVQAHSVLSAVQSDSDENGGGGRGSGGGGSSGDVDKDVVDFYTIVIFCCFQFSRFQTSDFKNTEMERETIAFWQGVAFI